MRRSRRYLPDFRVADEAASAQITVRHLLHHTSGLPEDSAFGPMLSTDISDQALSDRVARPERGAASPWVGAVFEYTDANYDALGLVVQTVSGQSYESYIAEHVFAPLGMRHSYTNQADAQRDGLATGHRSWFGYPRPFEAPYSRAAMPSSYLISSAEDLTHFLSMQLNGGQYAGRSVVSPDGIAAMHQPAVRQGTRDIFYGMGWESRSVDGVPVVRHDGTNANFYADMVLDPQDRWGVVILTNFDSLNLNGGRLQGLSSGVINLLHGQPPPEVTDAAPSAAGLRHAARRYRHRLDADRHRPLDRAAAALAYPAGNPPERAVGHSAARGAAVGRQPRLGTGPTARLPPGRLPPETHHADRARPRLPGRGKRSDGTDLGRSCEPFWRTSRSIAATSPEASGSSSTAVAMIPSAQPTPTKSRAPSETGKAAIFSALLLTLALTAALLIRALDPPQLLAYIIWGSSPLIAVLIMIFVITHDGRTRAGLELLGVHRLGLRLWWIAILGTFLISLLATAITWATPFASFATPDQPLDTVLNFVVNAIVTILTFAAVEELAWRGYLLPRLRQFGRNRALAITGLVHAGWHLPLILLTPLYHADGNLLIILPLFVGTIVAAGFVYGDLRLATGSIWPASIAHGVHNAAWGALSALTVTTSPVLVNEYLAGDTGVLILLATILAAFWLRRWLHRYPRNVDLKGAPS